METPIFVSHLRCMRAARDDALNRLFQANRARQAWIKDEIHELFSQMHNQVILARLGVRWTQGVTSAGEEELETLGSFWKLTVCMCSERAWFMLHYSDTCPEQFAAALDQRLNDPEALAAWDRIAECANVVLDAERSLGSETHPDRLESRQHL